MRKPPALSFRAFTSIATSLGYNPEDVLSIRVNPTKCVVTHMVNANLATATHDVVIPRETTHE